MENSSKSLLHQRALWRSRRGMLELDLLLRPFVETCFEQLSPEMQLALDELLQRDDFEILDLSRQPEQIPAYSALMRTVLQFQKTGELESFGPIQWSVKKHRGDPSTDE